MTDDSATISKRLAVVMFTLKTVCICGLRDNFNSKSNIHPCEKRTRTLGCKVRTRGHFILLCYRRFPGKQFEAEM
jgi:hypothetical protein